MVASSQSLHNYQLLFNKDYSCQRKKLPYLNAEAKHFADVTKSLNSTTRNLHQVKKGFYFLVFLNGLFYTYFS
jgi:hypothetical protein